jgi:ATP-dependent Clp protease ATP-binding subunit ClpC
MSEYMERHTVSRLVGAPPGYVGYDEGGQLTERVRRRPYSVVLFDEIEKAHPDVFNMLLQILEDGRLTDNKGRTVSFENTVLIMTSNIGAELIPGSREMQNSYEEVHALLMRELGGVFRPEFLNRVDEVIVFHALSDDELVQIADLLLNRVRRLASVQGLTLEISEATKRRIAREGYDSSFGARPLRRAIQKLVETPVSKEIIAGNFRSGDVVQIDLDAEGELTFTGRAAEQSEEEPRATANLAPETTRLGETTNEAGQTVQRIVDKSGNIMDSTYDQSGELVDEIPVGNLADLEEQPDATDAARERAEVLGVDLSRVEGSGAGGRITLKDVERTVQKE